MYRNFRGKTIAPYTRKSAGDFMSADEYNKILARNRHRAMLILLGIPTIGFIVLDVLKNL